MVLVSPKRPVSVGTVARALSCFECEDLRLVAPRCDHLARGSRNASKGAQYILWRAAQHDSLTAALADVELSVGFTRWTAGRLNAFRSLGDLLASPLMASALSGALPTDMAPAAATELVAGKVVEVQKQQQQQQKRQRPRLALVFGREERGFDAGELEACSFSCSLPIGRLQESLSLSHAVSIVLSQLFQLRQQQSGFVLPASIADLAEGYQDVGFER